MFDWNFGPQIQIYYLIAAWTLLAVIAMYALTRTPLGRMCNAVRDNPERVQFVGYDPHVVRYLAFCFAGFFAGIAGALAAINFEIANSAYLGALAVRQGAVLDLYRRRRLLHRADRRRDLRHHAAARAERPHHGLAALFRPDLHRRRDVRAGRHHRPVDDAPAAGSRRNAGHGVPVLSRCAIVPTLAMVAALILAIETIVHYTAIPATTRIKLFGIPFNATSPVTWIVAAFSVVGGFFVARQTWRRIADAWDERDHAYGGRRTRGYRRMNAPPSKSATSKRASAMSRIIRDLNLSVAQGERHALIGPNGAGKSTTFNLISGYIKPTSGRGEAERRV